MDESPELSEILEVSVKFKGKSYNAVCNYDYQLIGRGISKSLVIKVQGIPLPDGTRGVRAEFEYNAPTGRYQIIIRGCKDSSRNPEIEEFFNKRIRPTLEDELPHYMADLFKHQ
jgi:hypothetical protein